MLFFFFEAQEHEAYIVCTTLVQLGMLLQHVRVSIAFPYGHGMVGMHTDHHHMVIDVFGPSKYYYFTSGPPI